jgi:hypothetical protein
MSITEAINALSTNPDSNYYYDGWKIKVMRFFYS